MKGTQNINDFLSVVQLTDTHLFADIEHSLVGIKTAASLQQVLIEMQQVLPKIDLILMTGDLSQDCSADSYMHLREMIDRLAIPTHCLAGNHDDLVLMRSHLPSPFISLESALNIGKWHIILLSSVVENAVYGHLALSELAKLETMLQEELERPTLIAFHHPAISINSQWMDQISLDNQEEFWAICDRYPQVQVVINGHAHQDFQQIHETPQNSVMCLVTPSTCIQFATQNPNFQIDHQSPGFRHLRLYHDGRVETEVYRLKVNSFSPDLAAIAY
jgi:Icc protein